MALSLKGSASRGGTTTIKVNPWTLRVLEDTVSGTASVEMQGEGKRATTTFALDARAAKLDADALLLDTDTAPPPADPHRFDGMRGKIHAEVASLVFHKVPWRNVVLDATMQDDLFKVDRLAMDAAGGQVRLDGTSVRLGPVERPWDLKLGVKSLDLAQALTFGGKGKAFAGIFDGTIALAGKGTTLTAVQRTLDGSIDGNLKNGAFLGADLVSSVAAPLAKALPFATKALGGDRANLARREPRRRAHRGQRRGQAGQAHHRAAPAGGHHPRRGRRAVGGAGAGRHRGADAGDHQDAHRRQGDAARVHPRRPEPLGPGLGTADLRPGPEAGGAHHRQARRGEHHPLAVRTVRARQGRAGALGGAGATGGAEPTPGEQKAQSEAETLRQQAADEARKRLQGLFGK